MTQFSGCYAIAELYFWVHSCTLHRKQCVYVIISHTGYIREQLVRTKLDRHLHGRVRRHAACTFQPRRQCRSSNIRSRASSWSNFPAIPSAVGSYRTLSEGEFSPDPARSHPSQLQYLHPSQKSSVWMSPNPSL